MGGYTVLASLAFHNSYPQDYGSVTANRNMIHSLRFKKQQ